MAVFHGANGHFCAGWDLQAGAQHGAASAGGAGVLDRPGFRSRRTRRPPGPMGPSRLLLSKPVIAAVSGAAVAGGMELALWCDMRVMEEDAYFGVYCRRFGVPLIDGGTVRLPRLVGMGHAMDLILTGRKVEAAEALQMGLANRVVPKGEARDAAIELAQQLAKFPQETMLSDRMNAYEQWDLPLAAGAAPGMGAQQAPHRRRAGGRGALCRRRRPARQVLAGCSSAAAAAGRPRRSPRRSQASVTFTYWPCERKRSAIHLDLHRDRGAADARHLE